MTTAVDQNGTIATPNERGNLIAPIAAMTQSAMQQHHRWAGTVSAVPDPASLIFDVSIFVRDRQRRGTLRFELPEFGILNFHRFSAETEALRHTNRS